MSELNDAHATYTEVFDESVPPGGFVCSICGSPVESEPCPEHAPAEIDVVEAQAKQLDDVRALAKKWADRKRSDGISGNAWIGLALAAAAADLRAITDPETKDWP